MRGIALCVLAMMLFLEPSAGAQQKNLRMVVASPGYMWGIDEQIVQELKAGGVDVVTYPDAPMIDGGNQPPVINSWEQLSRYNVLIFGDQFYSRAQPSADTGEIPEHMKRTVTFLYRFLKEGGGILFSGPGEADFGQSVRTMNYVMKELDARAVREVIRDKDNLFAFPDGRFNEWCWTDKVTEHPLTRGVKGMWYPAAHSGDGGMGIVPFEVGPAWQILVKGMPSAAGYGIDTSDAAGTRLLNTPGAVKSSPNLIAVRQYGKGRAVFWPMWSPFGVFAGSRYNGGMLLSGERNGHKSDGDQLIRNLLCWLAEPSQGSVTIGLFNPATAKPEPTPVVDVEAQLAKWRVTGRKDYPAQFKGIIGAHSNISDGASSPKEMAAAARAAGYDFIAFTEDLARMDEAKWGQLVAACDAVNAESGSFLVSAPNRMWESRNAFSEPVSVEFSGVYLANLPKSGNNQLGLAPFGHGADMIVWAFDGSVKPNRLVPLRSLGGKADWTEGYRNAISLEGRPDITMRENAVTLRIDWWPGSKAAYYLNGRKVVEYTSSVPGAAVPVGVRDETTGFRLDAIKVTSLKTRDKTLLIDDFTTDSAFDAEKLWRAADSGAPVIQSDPKFLAYPGIDFMDDAGDRSVMFGNRWWPPKESFSDTRPERLKWLYSVSYQVSNLPEKWQPRVIIRSKTNNKRPWDQALWSFFSPYSYEAGKLVDDSFAEWREAIKRHVYFLNTGLMAVHTVRSAEEIAASAKGGLYQTQVRADSLAQVLSRLSGCVGPMGYFPSYISAGPEILDFRTEAVSGGEGVDLAVPGNDRFLLHLLVGSEAGLKEVAVYDGQKLVGRFLPTGRTFEQFLTFHPDEHHAFSMTVTDVNGREAVSWNAWMQVQERVFRRCGDNWNYMRTGKVRRAAPLAPHMLEATAEGLEHGTPAYFGEPALMGHGGLSAAGGRYITPDFQSLLVDGKPWPGNYPVPVLDFQTVGRYGVILTTRVRQDYLVERPAAYTTGAFGGPYAVTETPWPADLLQVAPEPRFNGAAVSLYTGCVEFSREVTAPEGKPISILLGASDARGHNPAGKRGCVLEVKHPDGKSEIFPLAALKDRASYDGEIPVKGYVAWYGPDAPGLGGVFALSPGVRYNFYRQGDYSWLAFRKDVPSPAKGETHDASWSCLYVDGSGTTANSNSEMEDIRLGMGFSGKPTLYNVEARTGRVVSQAYFLELEAEQGGFSGRIARTSDKLLPTHLPVMVQGLNPRWDAGLWYGGQTQLEVVHLYRDRWGVESPYRFTATYEPRTNELQHIPVLYGNTGYCEIDTDKQVADVFIGNLLVCDQQDVFISLVKAEPGRCVFEINNPTDHPLACTVKPAQGFDLAGKFEWTETLNAGAFKSVTVTINR